MTKPKPKSSFQIPAAGKTPMPTQIHATERTIRPNFKIPSINKLGASTCNTNFANNDADDDDENSNLAPAGEQGWHARTRSLGTRVIAAQNQTRDLSQETLRPSTRPSFRDISPERNRQRDQSAEQRWRYRARSDDTIPRSPHRSTSVLFKEKRSLREKIREFLRKVPGLRGEKKVLVERRYRRWSQ